MTGDYTRRNAHPSTSSAISKRKRNKVNYWDCRARDFDASLVSRSLSPRFTG